MEKRLGLIAGSGESASFIRDQAQALGYSCVTAAIRGEADPDIFPESQHLFWFHITEIAEIIGYFQNQDIQEAVFAGKIDPRALFQKRKFSSVVLKVLERARDQSPETIIRLAMDFFARSGIMFISPEPFLKTSFVAEGILTPNKPPASVLTDLAWGWEKARQMADADIGQCIVVKNKAVIAVEGLEGTDAAIIRAGELAGEGTVTIKLARSHQDPRVDLPAVGLRTMESVVHAKGAALCFEADKMPFFQEEKAIALARKHWITVLTRK